ncbi:hypothetical protein B0O99DRAFT_694356 [Bisporella sp. PMI_857]|nr:hypothetical protein B0O99DRAFT_694356 [Bisporella sp. PMI_857]
MAILAGPNYLSQNSIGGTAPGWASVAMVFTFNTFFSFGWLGMSWRYPIEIVPLRTHASSNGLGTSANWISNFLVAMTTSVCFSSIGYNTYIIFAVVNAVIVPIVYFFYLETAYRSLEESNRWYFQKTNNTFSVVSTDRNEPRRYGKPGELLIDNEKEKYHATVREVEHGGLLASDSNSEKIAT